MRRTVSNADYNARILHPLTCWLRERRGADHVAQLAAAAGLSPNTLDGGNEWISQEQFEAFLEEARETFTDDEEFKRAAVHRMADSYGLMRYLLWASTPDAVFAHAEKTYGLMSTVGSPRVLSASRTALHVRISADRPISRLNCIVRQAQTCELPTMWGLPPAVLRETACIAMGDPACEYHLQWFDLRRWYPPVLGFIAGSLLAFGAMKFLPSMLTTAVALPVLGALVGLVLELHRTQKTNLAFGAQQNEALRALAEEEAEARRELLDLQQRQREWMQILEAESAERALTIRNVISRIERSQEARDQALRGYSHDLNSPLTVLRLGLEQLAVMADQAGGDAPFVVSECEDSLRRVSRLLAELMEATRSPGVTKQMPAVPIDVGELTERLRRRLRAMVFRRDIRTTVFRTREAPDSLNADPLMLDRITDNLLSNAAKYTERGSIVVEVDGCPGFLVLKVLDSGRGIDPDRIERAFVPGASPSEGRPDSHGFGLSVVVRLLAEVGGRLEVMSKPGVGTTFWAYLPISGKRNSAAPPAEGEPAADLMQRIVKIRRAKSA